MGKTIRLSRCDLNRILYEYAVEVTNRCKGLDLVNNVHEDIWTEVLNTVQEAANKITPEKNKSQKAKWSSEEAVQIGEEKREVKSKGKKERCIQLNAEFQRAAWRDKKTFFNEQCIKLEENNRREKTRDIFKKIGDIKGTFHPKMGTIKDRNSRDLVDAEEIEMERIHGRTIQKRC